MTVETTIRKQSFAGGQDSLTFTFKVLPGNPEYVKVKTVEISTGIETDLVFDTDYTVALEADGVGGVVSVVASVSTSFTYTVFRVTTKVQESDYDDFNQFPADTVETDYDRPMCILQEIQEEIDRCLKAPVSSSITGVLPSPIDGQGLVWSGTGGTMINATVSTAAAQGFANAAATSSTAAASSATAALTSQIAAATSATNSATSAATIPSAGGGAIGDRIKVNGAQDGYEFHTPASEAAFLVRPAEDQSNLATGGVTVIWGTEVTDDGGNFAANTFTAPKAGNYLLAVNVRLNQLDSAASEYAIILTTSNRVYAVQLDPSKWSGDPVGWTFSLAVVADMDASDTAIISVTQVGGSVQTDVDTVSEFSGHLLNN